MPIKVALKTPHINLKNLMEFRDVADEFNNLTNVENIGNNFILSSRGLLGKLLSSFNIKKVSQASFNFKKLKPLSKGNETVYNLEQIACDVINESIEKGSYKNYTFRLRASLGYIIFIKTAAKTIKIVNFPNALSYNPSKLYKNVGTAGLKDIYKKTLRQSVEDYINLCEQQLGTDEGITVCYGAPMFYALYVESKGKNVIIMPYRNDEAKMILSSMVRKSYGTLNGNYDVQNRKIVLVSGRVKVSFIKVVS